MSVGGALFLVTHPDHSAPSCLSQTSKMIRAGTGAAVVGSVKVKVVIYFKIYINQHKLVYKQLLFTVKLVF